MKPVRCLLGVAMLLTGYFPVDLLAGSLPTSQSINGHYSGKQGQILVVTVPTDDSAAAVQGTFLGRSIRFFSDPRFDEPKGFVGLLGIDLQDEPGTHELTVELKTGGQTRTLRYSVSVVKEKFHVEHLTLPKDKVDLDDKSLARWKAEQEQVKTALAGDSPAKLWQPGFVEPVNGKRTGIFGSVRIMNGQPRNPHNGEDKLVLYGCGDLLTDYEGIHGYREFRGELSLMYFPTLDRATGALVSLLMRPTRLRRFRLERAAEADARWLLDMLNREGRRLGTAATLRDDGLFSLSWT